LLLLLCLVVFFSVSMVDCNICEPIKAPDTCLNTGCQFCFAPRLHCFTDPDQGLVKFHNAGIDQFCTSDERELNSIADEIDSVYIGQTFDVPSPQKITRLFGGRVMVIVAPYSYEMSSGTSNSGPSLNGMWLPSGGFMLTSKSDVCELTTNFFGYSFLPFGSIIHKPGKKGSQKMKDDRLEYVTSSTTLSDEQIQLFTSYLNRFDFEPEQLKYSLMLSDHCDEILKDFQQPQKAKFISECKSARTKLVPLVEILKKNYLKKSNLDNSGSVDKAVAGKFFIAKNAVQLNKVLLAHNLGPAVSVQNDLDTPQVLTKLKQCKPASQLLESLGYN